MPATDQIPQQQPFGDITGFMDFLKQFTGTESTSNGGSTSSIGPQASGLLGQLLERMLPMLDDPSFTPEAAVADSKGLVDQIMQTYKEQALPQIYQSQTNSGGYNSTTGQLMANDAYAKASAQGAAAVTATKEKYAGIKNSQMQSFVNVLLGLMAANKNTTSNSSTTSGKMPGSPLSNALKAAAGAAASNAARRAAKQPPKTPPAQQQDSTKSPEQQTQDQLNSENGPSQYETDPSGAQTSQDIMQQILEANAAGSSGPELGNGPDLSGDIFGGDPNGDTFGSGDLTGDPSNESDGLSMDNLFGDVFGGQDNSNDEFTIDESAGLDMNSGDIFDSGGEDFS